ncbi:MAG TPA: signal peptidase II [Terriglobales bacterium]|nr:signal peptidase II [Terriglobales bacterium]
MPSRFQLRHLIAGLAVFVADQLTKGMVDQLPDDFSHTVIPGVFRIIHAENPGVAFGLFQYASPYFRDLLIAASSLALLVVLTLLWRSRQTPRTGYAMALIVGGACGNLFDRILHGKVVDFLLFYLGQHSWPVFNLADSAIVIGASLLVWEIVHDHPAEVRTPNSAEIPADLGS